jgi:alpha-galactosidase
LSLERAASDGALRLSALIPGLHHPVAPGETFTLPSAFLGLFEGEWDEAGHRTQRFAEERLAAPLPPGYPWVGWDSWGYGLDLTEQILRENADAAARLGVELFVVDLGWARHIGDWRDDPVKFPGGLRAVSDHVHRLGMKFGIHFAPAEASPEAPVLQEHPDWTSSETDWYFGAVSLCLANRETREWVVEQAVRMIDDYNVDYIVQDGENMVKRCRRSDHSHHPMDSNWSNSVEGINWVVREVQRLRPHVLWENCEDGGHMMTFQMVQQYVTSITNDASGALDSRKGVWGATYPFTPRYTSRYMPEHPWSVYVTRSYMFGGPWHFMNRLLDMTAADTALATREIGIYKKIRETLRTARVFHLVGGPQAGAIDAIEGYSAEQDEAVVVVTRDGGEEWALVKPLGLRPAATYRIRFENTPRMELLSGRQLAEMGVNVHLPSQQDAEIVYIDAP